MRDYRALSAGLTQLIDFCIFCAIIQISMHTRVETWGQLLDVLLVRKFAFLGTFFAIFISSYSLLAWLDFLPEPKAAPVEEVAAQEDITPETLAIAVVDEPLPVVESVPVRAVYPDTITIPALDRSISVLNPASREVSDLDAALLYGVVRHPDSATLEQVGTVFVLGHSSYLPTVLNRNFQAFNGIQNLKFGDLITLESGELIYTYRVDRVYRAEAGDVTVPIAGDVQRLVLATCNSFGSVDDRYIVEAALVESQGP
jgi:LPXTG-site transpeptidase (sortase) family protein